MKILVIGGSYFFGRWFVQLARKEHEITVLNRGNIKVGLNGVTEYVADRHDTEALKKLSLDKDGYDAAVDFCAYEKGDISTIFGFLNTKKLKRYIFISTVDVYKRNTGCLLHEGSPIGNDDKKGVVEEYIAGKTELESEIRQLEKQTGVKCISVRPAILYGPGNYAPRESIYIDWIRRAGQIIHPRGADGTFQLIYVADAARGLIRLLELGPGEIKEVYNFCSDPAIDYDMFERALMKAVIIHGRYPEFETLDVNVLDVIDKGIPLPFPLIKAESERVNDNGFRELLGNTTPLEMGLVECLRVMDAQ